MHAALVKLFLEAARCGATPDALASELADVLSPAQARVVCELFKRRRDGLRAALEACSFGPPQLVDVQWHRSVMGSAKQRALGRSALYAVTLTTRQGEALDTVRFTATVEQLTCLVAELKSAVKQVDHECG